MSRLLFLWAIFLLFETFGAHLIISNILLLILNHIGVNLHLINLIDLLWLSRAMCGDVVNWRGFYSIELGSEFLHRWLEHRWLEHIRGLLWHHETVIVEEYKLVDLLLDILLLIWAIGVRSKGFLFEHGYSSRFFYFERSSSLLLLDCISDSWEFPFCFFVWFLGVYWRTSRGFLIKHFLLCHVSCFQPLKPNIFSLWGGILKWCLNRFPV